MRLLMSLQKSIGAGEGSTARSGVSTGRLVSIIVAVGAVLFFRWFPRYLVNMLGVSSPWTSYFYLYGNGLVVFLIGIAVILRSGACRLGRGWDTPWFVALWLGYFFFAGLHAAWIWAALHLPFRGGP